MTAVILLKNIAAKISLKLCHKNQQVHGHVLLNMDASYLSETLLNVMVLYSSKMSTMPANSVILQPEAY